MRHPNRSRGMQARPLVPGHGLGEVVFSLVLPTYNPGPRLERTWREISDLLRTAADPWEVLFICDGCTDGTPERLAGLCQALPQQVRFLSYAPNRGKGYAVRRGLLEARGPWRLFTDVDLAYSLDDVQRVAD